MWRPAHGYASVACSFPLKNALREEFGNGTRRLDRSALSFLRGLRAAEVNGAAELMELIEKHDEIEVWEEA